MIKTLFFAALCATVLILSHCRPSQQLNAPDYFPAPLYDFKKNKLQTAKIELGRALFYDGILSKDGSISCASCHSPYNGFAHTDHQLSHGIGDQIGHRNAPPLFNLAWQPLFMWDGAINHLDMQALAPISHPKEMGETIENVIHKLRQSDIYPALFAQAYGDTSISSERLLKALAQFQLSLISARAKYDQVKQGQAQFSPQEQQGYAIFLQHCNQCHQEPLFSSYQFANNGLPMDSSLQDRGRWAISGQSSDSLQFKIPSLRNLSYTYPYMHDGRFKKLSQVLQHYQKGINHSPSLAPALQNGIGLSSNEKADLIAFLLTLDDKEFVFAPQHQYPKHILNKK